MNRLLTVTRKSSISSKSTDPEPSKIRIRPTKSFSEHETNFDPGSPDKDSDGSINSATSVRSFASFKNGTRQPSFSASRKSSTTQEESKRDTEKTLMQEKRMSLLTTVDDDEKLDSPNPLIVIKKTKGRGSSIHSMASIEEQPAGEKPAIIGMRRKSSNSSLSIEEEKKESRKSVGYIASKIPNDRKMSLPTSVSLRSQISSLSLTDRRLPSSQISLGSTRESSHTSLAPEKGKEGFDSQKARLSLLLHQRQRIGSIQDEDDRISVVQRTFLKNRSNGNTISNWTLLITLMRLGKRLSSKAQILVNEKIQKFQVTPSALPIFDNSFAPPWIDQVIFLKLTLVKKAFSNFF